MFFMVREILDAKQTQEMVRSALIRYPGAPLSINFPTGGYVKFTWTFEALHPNAFRCFYIKLM
jgi:hypothetical protein